MHGRYYNNIYLGKRIFGPARKQVFMYTVVGGMERRFEIVDNQVNHIQFTHEHSDKFVEKCRNQRIKCKDDSRVVLNFPEGSSDSFIHANYVKSPLLFNDFIITQAPMDNTIGDFWRMIWQEHVCFIFMLIGQGPSRCAKYWPENVSSKPLQMDGLVIWNEGLEPFDRDPFFKITKLRIVGPNNEELRIEHWQGDLNNSQDMDSPLRLLRLARSCTSPTVIHDHLGISRAACLVAIELTLCQLLRGPLHKYVVQRSVHYLRFCRSFSVETPMQYIFIHRVVQHFLRHFVGTPDGFDQDYVRWIDERSQRLFVDNINSSIPAFHLLSPKVDPDLLPLVRHRERPELRRELHAHVGELPLPVEIGLNTLANVQLPKRYPRGKRYD
ncbi:Tyrosine-protein phosphatase domain-containing protein [Meloidogyne graminicola]|uniref:Tyrosine-protein phosphatase domain-containing protein n=1 Tax=Meloidogyne graminicola TaxID=189291 RepID=A0A8S9ZZE7_9BILA|nr:Tyrosine-protein phosphatase domain-containing protein [Meloidogyne graminicola]